MGLSFASGSVSESLIAVCERYAHLVAMLIATSDYEEVVQVADRAAVMARGGIVAELSGDDITTNRLLTEAAGSGPLEVLQAAR